MKKILCITTNKNDAVSFYRSSGIFKNLKKHIDIDVNIVDIHELNESWATLIFYDLVMLQRPNNAIFLGVAKYIQYLKIPLWVDWDDNYNEITNDNPSYNYYTAEIMDLCNDIVNMANAVTCTTLALSKELLKWSGNKNVNVIPNALNTDLFPLKHDGEQRNVVLWRGSETHILDLMTAVGALGISIEQNKEFKYYFLGYNPFFIADYPNKFHFAITDPFVYFSNIKTLKPLIVHVPLADTAFNRCKSNIAFIEATYADAVCLAPDWEEWQLPGVVNYTDQFDFRVKLAELINGEYNIPVLRAQAAVYINDNLTLDIINKQRAELINSLVK